MSDQIDLRPPSTLGKLQQLDKRPEVRHRVISSNLSVALNFCLDNSLPFVAGSVVRINLALAWQ